MENKEHQNINIISNLSIIKIKKKHYKNKKFKARFIRMKKFN